ncbi:MAG: DNA adenine methylase, partial [Spirochaetota bacterium]
GLAGGFGGRNGDALARIKGDIGLRLPLFSNFDCDVQVHRGDAREIAGRVDEVDVAYLDPPYNQHPYGSNYFMLNLLADYKRPKDISRVSGIPRDWQRSDFNGSRKARKALLELLGAIKAKFLLISFNSEGYIPPEEMKRTLAGLGRLETLETRYNTFKGSRNLSARQIHVREYLYLVEKG